MPIRILYQKAIQEAARLFNATVVGEDISRRFDLEDFQIDGVLRGPSPSGTTDNVSYVVEAKMLAVPADLQQLHRIMGAVNTSPMTFSDSISSEDRIVGVIATEYASSGLVKAANAVGVIVIKKKRCKF